MRIAGGAFKGRALQAPKGKDIRPTSDKVRQALFNILNAHMDLEGVHVIDAFCGTGALGLEALSRGAGSCLFIDKSADSLRLAKSNVAQCGAEEKCDFLKADSAKLADNTVYQKAGLVFLDPPYRLELVPKALKALVEGAWLEEDAILVVEADRREKIITEKTQLLSEKTYGDTKLYVYQLS